MPTTNDYSPSNSNTSGANTSFDLLSDNSDEESDSDVDLSDSNDPTPVKKNKEQEFSELLDSIGKNKKQFFLSTLNAEQINHLFAKIQTIKIETLALTFSYAPSKHLSESIKKLKNTTAAKSIQYFDIGGFTEDPIPVIESAIAIFKNLKTISCTRCNTLKSPDNLESIVQKYPHITFISIFPPTTTNNSNRQKRASANFCTLFNDKRSKPIINDSKSGLQSAVFWPPLSTQ